MRTLSEEEVRQVVGGNGVVGGIHIIGAYQAGQWIGEQINQFNEDFSGMSFGEALYYTFNE